jgi:hypothetical protein
VPAALVLASLAAACLAAYGLACWQAPFGACRCRHTNPLCRHCNGTGRRVRIGRRLFNYLRSLYDPPRHTGGPMPERPITTVLLALLAILAGIVVCVVCLVLAAALHLTAGRAATPNQTTTATTATTPAVDPSPAPAPAPGEYIPTPAGPPTDQPTQIIPATPATPATQERR